MCAFCTSKNQMAHEMHGILFGNVLPVSGGAYQPVSHGEESFLRDVVTPIYEVIRKVTPIFVLFASEYCCLSPYMNYFF